MVNGVGSRVSTWYFMASNGCGAVGSLLCIIYGQWLHMHVQQMTQPRGLIILTNPAKTAHRHCQQLNHMSLHWIKYVTKARGPEESASIGDACRVVCYVDGNSHGFR